MNKKEISCYETDASRLTGKADGISFPKNIEEIQKIINTSKKDIVPRGAGTGLAGGAIPNDSLVVSLEKMNKILNLDMSKGFVDVQAGISIKELNEKLNPIGFEFPIQPLNSGATIGGMIASNVSYPRNMKYNEIKNWIEEAEFVNGKGELIKLGRVDLSDIAGMEGITGIIVRVKLKIIQKLEKSISIFQTDSLKEALSISRRLKAEKDTIMIALYPKRISKLLGLPEKYNLLIEFNSDRGKIKGSDYDKIIKLKEQAHSVLAREDYYNFEIHKFFFDKLEEFISYLESQNIPYLGYIGAGFIYSFFKDTELNKQRKMTELVKKLGGRIAGQGIGIKRKDFLDNFERKIIKRIKLKHDPFWKLNKDKVIDYSETKNIYDEAENNNQIQEIKRIPITPEDKIEELIKEVELDDKKKRDLDEEELLRDYEYTYKSELPKERSEKIEEFAKDIPKQIEKKGRLSKEEQDIINKVMFGGSGLNNKKKTEDKEIKENDNRI